ncbi:MAG: SUMF1/EgtB/PvdO family nonheme iron enzyme [Candidatus Poribacteria bacterium]|nr:SUMF1/EgtB/PvdO family nonheme iron enzyme [Candidatus Poribacteria bacterium]
MNENPPRGQYARSDITRPSPNGTPDPDAILIPPSAFIMGTDIESFYGTILPQSKHAKPDEAPMHVVFLGPYLVDRYPVTNAEYEVFVQATGHQPPAHWKNGKVSPEQANLSVVRVSWSEANAYARWAGMRLPTEAEWEKAARGADGRIYPWGNEFEPLSVTEESDTEQKRTKERAGSGFQWFRASKPKSDYASSRMKQVLTHRLTPVGNRPAAASPYGMQEAAGNVWEWTADWYQPYTGNTHRRRDYGEAHKVLRGGSWLEVCDETAKQYFRCANRLHAPPNYTTSNVGFRCVRDITPEEAQAYPAQISAELLTKYVRQERLKNLRTVLKRARTRCLQDFAIAAILIGGACYAMMAHRLAIEGFMVSVIGVGLLFSAGINFWRQWKAKGQLKRHKRPR